MNARHWVIMLLPVVAVGIASLSFTTYSTDEYTYLNTASHFARGDFVHVEDPTRFPFFPFALSIAYSLFGESELIAKLFNLLVMGLTVAVSFVLARELFDEHTAFVAGLLTASSPFLLFLSTRVLAEPLFTLLSICTAYTAYKAIFDNRWLVGFGFFLGLTFLSRYPGLYLAPAALVFFLSMHGVSRRFRITPAFVCWGFLGLLVFLLTLVPWFVYSTQVSGDPFYFFFTFVAGQVQVGEIGLSLPDKIPIPLAGYLVVLPILLCFGTILWVHAISPLLKKWMQPSFLFILSFLFVPALILAGTGLLHPQLLRYIAPLTPMLAILLSVRNADSVGNGRIIPRGNSLPNVLSRHRMRVIAIAVLLNVILAFAALNFFAGYTKHVAHRQIGLYASEHCSSVYSNMPNVLEHYVGGWNTATPADADCVVVSSFEGGKVSVPPGYVVVYSAYVDDVPRVQVYKR